MAQVHEKIEEKSHEFLRHLYSSIRDYEGQLPNLGDIFRPEAIEWLLTESVEKDRRDPEPLVNFVINSGYKDEPDVDEDGKLLLHRTTPIHHAYRHRVRYIIPDLFKIYDRFDVNYTDEDGLTHFHIACEIGCDDVVEKFLDLGQDPNLLVTKTGESPLYLALNGSKPKVFELLLRRGANPNFVDHRGYTILHEIVDYQRYHDDDDYLDILFKITKEVDQVIEVDARNEKGSTPLQLAVLNFFPDAIDVLLDHGADLSGFVFPSEDDFDEELEIEDFECNFLVILASGILAVVERLEKRGYELDRSDAMTIMKVITKYGWLGKPEDIDDGWLDDEEFAREAKEMMIKSGLSIYDLIRLRPEEAAKLVTYEDYYKLAQSCVLYEFDSDDEPHEDCFRHIHEKLTKKFFRRWALDPFMDLTRQHLPILCCEMIIKQLKNEDLWHICLAATDKNIH